MKGRKVPRLPTWNDYCNGNTSMSTYEQDYKKFRNERVVFTATVWVTYYVSWRETWVRIPRGMQDIIDQICHMFEDQGVQFRVSDHTNFYTKMIFSHISLEQTDEMISVLTLSLPQEFTVKKTIKE